MNIFFHFGQIFWFIIQSEITNRENLIGNLETICKRFCRLCNSPELWRLMCSLVGGLPHSNVHFPSFFKFLIHNIFTFSIHQFSLPLFQTWKRSYFDWTESVRFSELEIIGSLYDLFLICPFNGNFTNYFKIVWRQIGIFLRKRLPGAQPGI